MYSWQSENVPFDPLLDEGEVEPVEAQTEGGVEEEEGETLCLSESECLCGNCPSSVPQTTNQQKTKGQCCKSFLGFSKALVDEGETENILYFEYLLVLYVSTC